MAIKKYTLCFKGKNKYGHEHVLPLVSLSLKDLDKYTTRYSCYADLFNGLPDDVIKFIKDNLCYNVDFNNDNNLENHFFIERSNEDECPNILFCNDAFVLGLGTTDLTNLIINEIIGCDAYKRIYLKSKKDKDSLKRYDFFKYLYEKYVKDQKIMCMVDVYDTKEQFPFLKDDELMIASIATDKDNVKVVLKKLGQSFEARRNLLLMLKEINPEFLSDFIFSTNNNEIDEVLKQIRASFNEYQEWYDAEYEVKGA